MPMQTQCKTAARAPPGLPNGSTASARDRYSPGCESRISDLNRCRRPGFQEGCPWNFYRSSGDVRASYASIRGNLATTIPLAAKNLSYPGCWAYP